MSDQRGNEEEVYISLDEYSAEMQAAWEAVIGERMKAFERRALDQQEDVARAEHAVYSIYRSTE